MQADSSQVLWPQKFLGRSKDFCFGGGLICILHEISLILEASAKALKFEYKHNTIQLFLLTMTMLFPSSFTKQSQLRCCWGKDLWKALLNMLRPNPR